MDQQINNVMDHLINRFGELVTNMGQPLAENVIREVQGRAFLMGVMLAFLSAISVAGAVTCAIAANKSGDDGWLGGLVVCLMIGVPAFSVMMDFWGQFVAPVATILGV